MGTLLSLARAFLPEVSRHCVALVFSSASTFLAASAALLSCISVVCATMYLRIALPTNVLFFFFFCSSTRRKRATRLQVAHIFVNLANLVLLSRGKNILSEDFKYFSPGTGRLDRDRCVFLASTALIKRRQSL